jgi:hypothetical protein
VRAFVGCTSRVYYRFCSFIPFSWMAIRRWMFGILMPSCFSCAFGRIKFVDAMSLRFATTLSCYRQDGAGS